MFFLSAPLYVVFLSSKSVALQSIIFDALKMNEEELDINTKI
jgi:hypothetical protein